MEYRELPAPPPLDTLVRCFWFLRGEKFSADPQVVVPDGRLEIVLHLAEPFARIHADGREHVQEPILLSGQLTAPLRLRAGSATDIVGIRFRTATARCVLALPLAELTDRVEPLTHVSPQLACALFAAAATNTARVARVAALTRVLLRYTVRSPDPLATAALRTLDASAARVSVLAERFGVTPRTLERRVREHAGLAPNVMRRLLRFRRAFRLLDGAPAGTWARVAAHAGYFDQAHLIRDFHQFAGAAPSEFFGGAPDLARAILTGDEHAA